MTQDHQDESLRKHVLYLLGGGGAHLSFDDFVNSFPPDLCNRQIEGLPYTSWQVLEHMRLAQWDILEFSRDASHVSPEWPKGYWPQPDELGNPIYAPRRMAFLSGTILAGCARFGLAPLLAFQSFRLSALPLLAQAVSLFPARGSSTVSIRS